jgi:hypothetical protein
MRKRVSVYTVSTQMLEHLADDAFPCGDIAGQTDDVLARPIAHGFSSDDLKCALLYHFTAYFMNL